MEYSYRILDGSFRSHTLYRLYHDAFSLFTCSQFGIVHDIIDIRLRLSLCLFFQRLYQAFFCLFGRQTGKCFQFFNFLMLEFVQFLFLFIHDSQLCFQILSDSIGFGSFTLNLFLTLAQHHFTLFQLIFGLLDLLVTQGYLLLQICFLIEKLLFYFQQFVLLNHFCFCLCFFQDIIIFGLQSVFKQYVR